MTGRVNWESRSGQMLYLAAIVWVIVCALSLLPAIVSWQGAVGLLRAAPWRSLVTPSSVPGFLFRTAPAVLVVVPVIAWASSGRLVLSWLVHRCDGYVRFPASLLMGFSCFGTGLFALALCGLVTPQVLAVTMILGIALSAATRGSLSIQSTGLLRPSSLRLPLIVALCPFVFSTVLALVPDQSVDVYSYHMAVPQQVLLTRKFSSEGTTMQYQWPLTVEMNYLFSLVIGLDALPHFLQVIPFGAGLLLVARWAATAGGSPAGWVAMVSGLASLSVYSQVAIAKNDLAAAGFVLAGAAVIAGGRRALMGLAAAMFGCALGVKVTTVVPAVLALWWILMSGRLAQAALFATVSAVPFTAWAAKSWLLMGDPLWPLLSDWFPGALWDQESSHAVEIVRGSRGIPDLIDGISRLAKALMVSAPAVAMASPLVVLFRGTGPREAEMGVFALLSGYLVYAAMPTQGVRFSLPAQVIWSSVIAVGVTRAARAWAGSVRHAGAWGAAILSVIPLSALLAGETALRTQVSFLAGQLTQQELFEATMSTYADAASALGDSSRNGRIITTGDIRTFRMPGRHLGERCFGRGWAWTLAKTSETPAEVRKRFRQLGCQILLHNFVTEAFPHPSVESFSWDDRMLIVWGDFVRRHLEVVVPPRRVDRENGGFVIYKVRARPLAQSPRWIPYLPGIEGRMYPVTRHGLAGDVNGWVSAARRLYHQVPDVDDIRDQLALGLRLRGSWDAAWELYRIGIEHGTLTGTNLWDAAVCAMYLRKWSEAERLLVRCREVSPRLAAQVTAALEDIGNARASMKP